MPDLFKFFPAASALLFSTLCTFSHAELEEEIINVIYLNAELDDEKDASIYPENWSDTKKNQH